MNEPRWWDAEVVVELDPTVPDGHMRHHVVLPAGSYREVAAGDRVEGALDGVPFSRVVAAGGDGQRLLRFGRDWLRQAGIEVGDLVPLRLRLDPDPDRVDVPGELANAFVEHPELEHRWESLTAGRRRTLVYPIERARRPETRAKRVQAILDELDRPRG
ncbi:YdeI/OmpD-associated family protein [Egicoccus sp. AB-alg2]|uniref:YdeI/OmpD-associated family protein n=1 Tax=Egicoccus sp. AB-alg2 TaxID=3242693 RepID=UPI00359DD84E